MKVVLHTVFYSEQIIRILYQTIDVKQNFKKFVVTESLQVVLCLITDVNLTQQNNFSVVSMANL